MAASAGTGVTSSDGSPLSASHSESGSASRRSAPRSRSFRPNGRRPKPIGRDFRAPGASGSTSESRFSKGCVTSLRRASAAAASRFAPARSTTPMTRRRGSAPARGICWAIPPRAISSIRGPVCRVRCGLGPDDERAPRCFQDDNSSSSVHRSPWDTRIGYDPAARTPRPRAAIVTGARRGLAKPSAFAADGDAIVVAGRDQGVIDKVAPARGGTRASSR